MKDLYKTYKDIKSEQEALLALAKCIVESYRRTIKKTNKYPTEPYPSYSFEDDNGVIRFTIGSLMNPAKRFLPWQSQDFNIGVEYFPTCDPVGKVFKIQG